MRFLALALVLLLGSCSVEERIFRWSYTPDWYWKGGSRYQVYKTLTDHRYIIEVDSTTLELKRTYIKAQHETRLD